MDRHFSALSGILIFVSIVSSAQAATILKAEPPMGGLKEGQRVLVDDGSCGPGKIMEVTGGNHTKAGGKSNVIRQYRCVAR